MFLECLQISFGMGGAEEGGPPKGSRGRAESPLVASAEAKAPKKQKKVISFPCLSQEISCGPHPLQQGGPRRFPKGDRKALWSPPQRRNPLRNKKRKKERLFPLPPQETCLLWEVSSACGRTRYFPRAGKYPKGAGGGQRVHVSWPPPDPPLLSYSAPLASQGRAQLGSLPSLGGPLSPSAQLIPPPAPWRRFILRV